MKSNMKTDITQRDLILDLIWLTNIPAPYRIPTWHILNRRLNFKILFLNSTEMGRNWDLSTEMKGLKYVNLNLRAVYFIKSLPLYLNFIQPIRAIRELKSRAIYIDGWESPAFFISALYAKRQGTKIIYGYRSTQASHRFNNILIRKLRSSIFSKADFIVTAGSASTKAVEAMGIVPKKIITLFNPVDVSWFHSYSQSHRVEQTHGHRFIYVGQLIERKNVFPVICAFAAIRTELDTLIIAGDGVLAQSLKELAQTLCISDSVIFSGHQSQEELAKLYARSNTLILASTNEVWGLVVNEALASGLHVVVSEKCGVADFIKDMKGVYLCSTDQISIQKELVKSAQDWCEYIEDPEILKFTPEKFADGLIETMRAN
jgi:glycosyltransferase involved in cell wall biosynthesis